ncbi:DUF2851 family protein [Riemerella anatipestifer]|uniref:DUF2851 family protein n=1 Tax=Riemerella anatipestifer TaxID=34085 RepID=UPI002A8AA342|nr:DUF2851 family protein [Riemerella anatipestifer]
MTEQLLQYLWNFKLFKTFDFKDTKGNKVEVLDFGQWNSDEGADFLFAKIKYQNIVLAGSIELHLKSSDYQQHQHHLNRHYDNIILHVVYTHDKDVEELVEKNIPTLELKDYLEISTLEKYQQLKAQNEFIPCEKLIEVSKIPFQFSEEILLKKLDQKSLEIETELTKTKNNYEEILFRNLAYAFGLKINASIFKQMAESVGFAIVNKIRHHQNQLEALFFGLSGWLETPSDTETEIWKREFDFLKAKYQLSDTFVAPKFLRLRPANFPTIRLSQLAHLYHLHQNLFSKVIKASCLEELYELFTPIKASEYWDNHYNFGKPADKKSVKKLTKSFMDLVILNAVLPLKYTYHKHSEEEISETILDFYQDIKPEKNSIIEQWEALGVSVKTAMDSQAYLFQYKNFCSQKKCLTCGIGYQLLKR